MLGSYKRVYGHKPKAWDVGIRPESDRVRSDLEESPRCWTGHRSMHRMCIDRCIALPRELRHCTMYRSIHKLCRSTHSDGYCVDRYPSRCRSTLCIIECADRQVHLSIATMKVVARLGIYAYRVHRSMSRSSGCWLEPDSPSLTIS